MDFGVAIPLAVLVILAISTAASGWQAVSLREQVDTLLKAAALREMRFIYIRFDELSGAFYVTNDGGTTWWQSHRARGRGNGLFGLTYRTFQMSPPAPPTSLVEFGTINGVLERDREGNGGMFSANNGTIWRAATPATVQ